MIWATVNSWSRFCWLYRAFPSLAAKNIINLISVLAIWWGPCVESSLLLLEEGVCYDQRVLLAKLYQPLPCFILYQGQIFLLLQLSFDLLLLHSSPIHWKGHLFWVLVLEGLVGLMSEWVSEVAQSCLTVCDRRDCSLPEFSVHGILQARILEWFTISFSRGSSWPR